MFSLFGGFSTSSVVWSSLWLKGDGIPIAGISIAGTSIDGINPETPKPNEDDAESASKVSSLSTDLGLGFRPPRSVEGNT